MRLPAVMSAQLEVPAAHRAAKTIGSARHAQRYWAQLPVRERLRVIRKFRGLLAGHLSQMLSAVARSRRVTDAEILVSEVLPLLDAAKFLERTARKTLQPRRMSSRLRPVWLGLVELEIRREPFGVVVVIGPGNYPLFLAGVQVLQALVAGNAVLLKPGHNALPALRVLQALLVQAGLDAGLLTLLSEDEDEARRCIEAGVDKIVLTGSSDTGHAVLTQAAQTLTPVAAELSGVDAVFVLEGADIPLAARAIVFGLTLNHSRTCMRPHRIFVHESVRASLKYELCKRIKEIVIPVDIATAHRLTRLVAEAVDAGARVANASACCKQQSSTGEVMLLPLLMEDVPVFAELASADIFAPILLLEGFMHLGQAVELYGRCPYALGASIFAPERFETKDEAQELASKINAGFVMINDLIVPTADPRLPFSGRGRSGFGVTRGSEGLLELTRVKAISTRLSGYKHLEPVLPGDGAFFGAFIRSVHGGNWRVRWQALKNLVSAARSRSGRPTQAVHVAETKKWRGREQ